MLPQVRAVLAPLPDLMRLLAQRFIEHPDLGDDSKNPEAQVTSTEFLALWGNDEHARWAARLLTRFARWILLPVGTLPESNSYLQATLASVKYEHVLSLDDYLRLSQPVHHGRVKRNPRGPHLALLRTVYASLREMGTWPRLVPFTLQHRGTLGFIPSLVDELTPAFIRESRGGYKQPRRIILAAHALPFVEDEEGLALAVRFVRTVAELWFDAAPGPGTSFTIEQIAARMQRPVEKVLPLARMLEHQPWGSGDAGLLEDSGWRVHVAQDAIWRFKELQSWEQYVTVRDKEFSNFAMPPEDPFPSDDMTRAPTPWHASKAAVQRAVDSVLRSATASPPTRQTPRRTPRGKKAGGSAVKRGPLHLRVFLSSPGDVTDERRMAREVVDRLQKEPLLRGRVTLELVAWDDPNAPTPMEAGETPQRTVNRYSPRPSECDLTLVILWSRLGTPLPEQDARPDGTRYASGTEWEFEDAQRAKKTVFVYHRTYKPQLDIDDPDFDVKRAQYAAVKKFLGRFTAPDGSLRGGYNAYPEPEAFSALLKKNLESFLRQRLDDGGQEAPRPPPEPSWRQELTVYQREALKRYQRLDLEGLTPPEREEYLQIQLRSVFVEAGVRENAPPLDIPKEVLQRLSNEGELHPDDLPREVPLEEVRRVSEVYYEQPPIPVFDALARAVNEQVILLGDPGSGKSTLARYILLSLVDEQGDERVRKAYERFIPLLIELRSYVALRQPTGPCATLFDYIERLKTMEGYYPSTQALRSYLKEEGRVLFIFDGLDEVFQPEERDEVAREIAGLGVQYPQARVLVTSRHVGYRRKILTDAGFRHYSLQDLSPQQTREFLDAWFSRAMYDRSQEAAERTQRLAEALEASPSIRALSGNPLLLTILAIIGKNQELPRERWKLYEHAATVLIQHWDVNRLLRNQQLHVRYIDADDKKEMLRRLAYKMQASRGLAGNYIHKQDLLNEFEDYVQTRYGAVPTEATPVARAIIQQLHERNFIISPFGAGLYGFVHRGFLEYFCAASLTHKFEKTRKLDPEQLKREVYGQHWSDQSWHEVLRLIAGVIDPSFTANIIEYLCAECGDASAERTKGRPPWHLALALQCLREVKRPAEMAVPAARLLEGLCMEFDKDMASVPIFYNFMQLHVVPHLMSIGTAWPERHHLARLLKQRAPQRYSYIYDKLFGISIGALGRGDSQVHAAVLDYASSHSDPRQRVLAPFALAQGWPEGGTYSRLTRLARSDTDASVRYAALYALADHYPRHEGTAELLREMTARGPHALDRASAASGLARQFRADPETFRLLAERLREEEHKYPRTIVALALAEYFADREETRVLLTDAAVRDESPGPEDEPRDAPYHVREAALHGLVLHWPHHSETLTLLEQRAAVDPTPWLREWAAQALTRLRRTSRAPAR
ncbi:NACHT domain-containing protein [Pyxidicoccus trucidator]|uniref:NACHT domain-containing protein n=1 Tax=Pyxidicoccus trucidator TaxID=2709662 RepID=UPI001967A95B|nr:NACHT domain-containing protein [Pyxidicoccus trucidator]